MILRSNAEKRFVKAVGLLSVLCLGLFLFRIVFTHSLRYWFISGNLALACASLIFGWLLIERLKTYYWDNWLNLLLTLLWLIFLPNSWYVLTDLIHVYPSSEINQLYDITLISSLVVCGFFLGFSSLYVVHRE